MNNQKKVWLNGTETIPFRGSDPPLYRRDDPDTIAPLTTADTFARVYNLAKSDELKKYEKDLDLITKKQMQGLSLVRQHRVDFIESKGTYTALLVWSDLFKETKKDIVDHVAKTKPSVIT